MPTSQTATEHASVPIAERLKGIAGIFGIHLEESPRYTLVYSEGNCEIRRYGRMLTASTTVRGPWEIARREAFQRLADYIFGRNSKHLTMPMTSPVFQQDQVVKMPSPVLQEYAPHGLKMTFVLPENLTLESAPQPNDPLVEIEEWPPVVAAVLKYSGMNDPVKSREQAEHLMKWVEARHLAVNHIRIAEYDAPYVIPFLRRNEVQAVTKSFDT